LFGGGAGAALFDPNDPNLAETAGGGAVAAISAKGATAKEVKRTAWDDHKQSSNTA
jgi:hypothetical protein